MQQVNIYIVPGIRGPKKQKGLVCYQLEAQTSKGPATVTEFVPVEASEVGATLTAWILAVNRVKMTASIAIYADCRQFMTYINNGYLKKWQERDWCNAKGERISDWEKWREAALLHIGREITWSENDGGYRKWMETELRRRKEQNGGRENV